VLKDLGIKVRILTSSKDTLGLISKLRFRLPLDVQGISEMTEQKKNESAV